MAERSDDAEVVRDHDDGQPARLAQFGQEVDDLDARGHVERAHGLVGKQQARMTDDGTGDRDALTLAAGELVRVAGDRVGGQTDGLESFGDPRRGVRPACDAERTERLGDDPADALAGIERGVRVLEDRLDSAPEAAHPRPVLQVQPIAVEEHVARGRSGQAEHELQEGGLPCPRLADESHTLTGFDGEGDVFEGSDAAPPVGVSGFPQFEDRGHDTSSAASSARALRTSSIVYGSVGADKSLSTGPVSTTRP